MSCPVWNLNDAVYPQRKSCQPLLQLRAPAIPTKVAPAASSNTAQTAPAITSYNKSPGLPSFSHLSRSTNTSNTSKGMKRKRAQDPPKTTRSSKTSKVEIVNLLSDDEDADRSIRPVAPTASGVAASRVSAGASQKNNRHSPPSQTPAFYHGKGYTRNELQEMTRVAKENEKPLKPKQSKSAARSPPAEERRMRAQLEYLPQQQRQPLSSADPNLAPYSHGPPRPHEDASLRAQLEEQHQQRQSLNYADPNLVPHDHAATWPGIALNSYPYPGQPNYLVPGGPALPQYHIYQGPIESHMPISSIPNGPLPIQPNAPIPKHEYTQESRSYQPQSPHQHFETQSTGHENPPNDDQWAAYQALPRYVKELLQYPYSGEDLRALISQTPAVVRDIAHLLPKDLLTLSENRRADHQPEVSLSMTAPPAVAPLSTTQPSAREPIRKPRLCAEQRRLKDLILSGVNVFYTGSAGCGKSTVLQAFVEQLKEMGKQVDIIAPTGRAALAINGSTTWTYAGWTPDSHKKSLDKLKQSAHGKFVRKRLMATDVLVIDEISMVENLHFERLNAIMKEARYHPSDLSTHGAFGGVQIVVTGDFCQLPPVKPFQHCIECGHELIPNVAKGIYRCVKHGEYKDIDKWAFRSRAWEECDFRHVNLTKIHRQSDKIFIDILNKCRMGEPLKPADTNLLLDHECNVENAVRLFSTKEEVRKVNLENFIKLKTKTYCFPALDNFMHNAEKHRHLEWKNERLSDGSLKALQDHRFDTKVYLKEGMLVVLLVNLSLPEGLVNGTQGVITGFEPYDPAKLPKRADSGRRNRDGSPDPLGGDILGGDYGAMKEEMVKRFILEGKLTAKVWPIVQFDNGVTRTVFADCTINELGDDKPYSLLCRTQIPLTAAWAMSIHKSQGMTLSRVTVDLSRSFEEGQMYVALSRARGLDGLKVDGLGKSMGRGNEQVREFLWEKFKLKC